MKLDDAAFDAAAFDDFCRDLFPARGRVASYEYVSCEVRAPSWGNKRQSMLVITVRLVTYERDDNSDAVAIRDVKEQEVSFARADEELARVQAYLAAFVDVLSRAFDAAPEQGTWETLMPHDFVHADVLSLKTAHVKADFVKAFERPSRMGRWLGSASASSTNDLPPEDALAPPAAVDDDKSL